MTKDEVLKIAQDACPYFDEISRGAFYEGFITALDHFRGVRKSIEPDMGIDRGAWDDVPDATKWVDELRGGDKNLEEPPNSTTSVVERDPCIVGMKGSAYDSPDTKRAYTYANQPGNVVAYKLGRASSSASLQRAGDFIDSGLILLKELQVEGYGVFDIGAEYTAPPSKPWVSLTEEEPVAKVDDDGFIVETGLGLAEGTLLYTKPPKREFIGLTDKEIAEGARQSWVDRQAFESAVWWAEAKLREKNGF